MLLTLVCCSIGSQINQQEVFPRFYFVIAIKLVAKQLSYIFIYVPTIIRMNSTFQQLISLAVAVTLKYEMSPDLVTKRNNVFAFQIIRKVVVYKKARLFSKSRIQHCSQRAYRNKQFTTIYTTAKIQYNLIIIC